MSGASVDGARGVRVLHVSQPDDFGVGVHVRGLVEHEVAQGWDVHVACPGRGRLAGWVSEAGASWWSWDTSLSPVRVPLAWWRLRRLVRRVRPDVVHLHSSKAGLVGRLSTCGSVPVVFTPNGWSFLVPRWRFVARRWERWASRRTSLVIAVSSDELRMAQKCGIECDVVTISNGVDVDLSTPLPSQADARERLQLGSHQPIAVCVGRICPQKGQLGLARRWGEVQEAVPGARLVLVGSGRDRRAIRQLRADGVMLVGRRDDVPDWLAAADIGVQPSRWEGMSYVTLETWASGRHVVAFDVSGMKEVVGPFGTVVPVDAGLDAFIAATVRSLRRRSDLLDRADDARAQAAEFRRSEQNARAAELVRACAGAGRAVE